MQAKVAKLDKNMVELEVEVETGEVQKAMEEAFRRVSQKVKIPGFRPGKAPRNVVENYTGKAPVYEEVVDILFPKAYSEAVEETKIEPIDQPELDLVQLEEGKPFIFKAKVAVKPEVQLGSYKGLEATKHSDAVTDQEVDEVLNDLRDRYAELEAVEDRQVVEKGDYILLDFEGYMDGKPFAGGAGHDVMVQVGEGRFIPSFEEQIPGLEKGVEKEIKVKFPDDYGAEQLAGKDTVFKLKATEIKKKTLPELNDDFAKTVGQENLDGLKKDVRENMEKERTRLVNMETQNKVIDQAVDNAKVEVPEVLVQRRLDRKLQDLAMNLAQQGMHLHDYLGKDRTEDDLKKQMQPDAEREVKTALVLEAIAKAEGLKVSPEEMDQRLEKLLELESRPDEEKRATVAKVKGDLIRQGRLESLADQILMDKTVDFLVEAAKIKTE